MKWEPIETAPENYRFLVSCEDGSGIHYAVARREGDQVVVDIDPSRPRVVAKPTHWLVLPPPLKTVQAYCGWRSGPPDY